MNGLASITYPGKQTAFSRSVYTCTHVLCIHSKSFLLENEQKGHTLGYYYILS